MQIVPDDSLNTRAERDLIQRMMKAGMEILGNSGAAAISAALGLLFAGPPGAAIGGAAGAAVSMALKRIGSEIASRLLGPREQIRVGYVFASASAQIRQRIENGETLRADGFFDSVEGNRSQAEEVVESILLKSQREPQEKKLPYMVNLLANIAFDEDIGTQLAHQVIKAAEQLTYRQFCMLKMSAFKVVFDLRNSDYRGHGAFTKELYSPLYDCYDLYIRGIVNFGGPVAFGPTDVKPGSMTVQGIGADIFNLMKLQDIPHGT